MPNARFGCAAAAADYSPGCHRGDEGMGRGLEEAPELHGNGGHLHPAALHGQATHRARLAAAGWNVGFRVCAGPREGDRRPFGGPRSTDYHGGARVRRERGGARVRVPAMVGGHVGMSLEGTEQDMGRR